MWYFVILSNSSTDADKLVCWITAAVSEGDLVDVMEQPGHHWQVFRVRKTSTTLPDGVIYTATKVGA